MTRAVAVAALLGCACANSSRNVAAPSCPACPACPAVPTVDLAVCPAERPVTPLVVEPRDYRLGGGSGFWCVSYTSGKWAGDADCFRRKTACEKWRGRQREKFAMSECTAAPRAICMELADHERQFIHYRCYPPGQCEAARKATIPKHPNLEFSECRETD